LGQTNPLIHIVGSKTSRGRSIVLNKYETIFIIDPNIEPVEIEKIAEDVQNLISGSDGVITKVSSWGKKSLAYEVQGNREGFYVVIKFEADPQFVQRLGRYYSLTEQIIKSMTVRAEKLPEPREIVGEDEDRGSRTDESRRGRDRDRDYDDDDDDDDYDYYDDDE
jgi:small subunit ribosomal protein S6